MSTLVFPSLSTPRPPKPNQVDDYTEPGTYSITPPDGARFVVYEGIGGGAAGSYTGSNGVGGGGGARNEHMFTVANLTWPQTLIVGAGGATKGAAGTSTSFGGVIAGHGAINTSTIILPGDDGGGSATTSAGLNQATQGNAGGTGGTGYGPTRGLDSKYGAGGGAGYTTTNGKGGTSADPSMLLGGNGGMPGVAGSAPGGGGGATYNTFGAGADGAARFTWIF